MDAVEALFIYDALCVPSEDLVQLALWSPCQQLRDFQGECLKIRTASEGADLVFQRSQIRYFLLEDQIRCAERREVAAEDAHPSSPRLGHHVTQPAQLFFYLPRM